MVLPLYDDNADRRRVPYVNYALLALNVLVFVVFQQLGQNETFTLALATVPEEIVTGHDVQTAPEVVEDPLTGEKIDLPGLPPTPLSPYITLLTSMFLHGSIMHLLGNMLFLWIFGDNVEDYLGHARYLAFYLVTGILASLTHVFVTLALAKSQDELLIPSLGASGAISGVLGGYVLLFPHRRVLVLLLRFVVWVPAVVAIGAWFLFQLVLWMGDLGSQPGGGVAYGAHVGGFVAGLGLVKLFAAKLPPPSREKFPPRRSYRRPRPPWQG